MVGAKNSVLKLMAAALLFIVVLAGVVGLIVAQMVGTEDPAQGRGRELGHDAVEGLHEGLEGAPIRKGRLPGPH